MLLNSFHWIDFYVWFMSYLTCWNCHPTRNLCFLLIFSWEKLQPIFAVWDTFKLLRCLNSKETKLQSSIKMVCTRLDLMSFQLKIQKKTKISSSMTISTCRVWDEPDIKIRSWLFWHLATMSFVKIQNFPFWPKST